jgi:hypothetical protein
MIRSFKSSARCFWPAERLQEPGSSHDIIRRLRISCKVEEPISDYVNDMDNERLTIMEPRSDSKIRVITGQDAPTDSLRGIKFGYVNGGFPESAFEFIASRVQSQQPSLQKEE